MTVQYPRRRETDAQAKARVAALEERRVAYLKTARPLGIWELLLGGYRPPRISASGRLVAR